MNRYLSCIIIGLFIFSFTSAEPIVNPGKDNDKWFTRGTFYEVLIRSYKDSNGDKSGDIKGLIEKLDYIQSLGITGIWLLPVTPSSEKAEGYDVTDYMNINPDYGTMEDFKELLDKAHSKNIRIILDFVINHTSSKHPFFQDALNNKNSKYRSWYHFSNTKHEGLMARYSEPYPSKNNPEGYYYARFVKTKPDLNYNNPEVIQYMKSVIKFWLDLGVDGFRYDAVSLLCEDKTKIENNAMNYKVMAELKKYIDENYKGRDIFVVAEAASDQKSFLSGGMFDAVFNLKLNNNLIRYTKNGTPFTDKGVDLIEDEVRKLVKDITPSDKCSWATLLSNHDSYVGTRPYQQLDKDINKTKLAGALYLTLPGIPFVYYGEEIAMDTFTSSKSDKWLRTCMIWDESKNYGFTDAENGWNMLNAGDDTANKLLNVAVQEKDPDSLLNFYKKLIAIRNTNTALSLGDFESIKTGSMQMCAYIRTHNANQLIVIHNFSEKKQSVTLNISETSSLTDKKQFTDLMNADRKISINKNSVKIVNIKPFETVILKAE